jgi:hypothetical protein
MTEEGNTSFVLHNDSFKDLAGDLTELAQIKRAVGDHEEANRIEMMRNTLYSQCGTAL